MQRAHCRKALATSWVWPFLPLNSGIWILLKNPSFFLHLPPEERVPLESLPLWPLWLLWLPRLLWGVLSEIEVSVDTPSSSEDWWWLGNALLRGESGANPGAGLLPANPHQTGELLGMSSSRDDCRATWGWNGWAVAERVESTCKVENHCWSSQRACLRLSFSILLHPAKISPASEVLMHFTLHVAKYPIQVGILANAFWQLWLGRAKDRPWDLSFSHKRPAYDPPHLGTYQYTQGRHDWCCRWQNWHCTNLLQGRCVCLH